MNINPLTWPLSHKIPASIILVGFLAVSLIGVFSFTSSKTIAEIEAEEKLFAVMEDRSEALEKWIRDIQGDLNVQAQNPLIHDALEMFSNGWRQMGANPAEKLQRLYITQNPHPAGEKEALDAAPDGSAYSLAHAAYHPYLRTFLHDRGYYDIFLFDAAGNVVYSVYKELDFATNVNSGEWADTDLGNVFREARDNPEPGYEAFFDFKVYAPSNGAAASFVATPILNNAGRLQGVLAFQMPSGRLNELMHQRAGLGETGETYIVGADLLMRSDSVFSEETTLLKLTVDTDQVKRAFQGETGVTIGNDYKDIPVVAAFKPFTFFDTHWVVIAEQHQEETYAPVVSMRNQLIIGALAGIALISVFGFFVGRSISRPIGQITKVISELADDNTAITIDNTERTDEIGEIARAAEIFKDNLNKTRELVAEQEKQKQLTEKEKRQVMLKMADDFDDNIGGIVGAVSSASIELDSTALSMVGISKISNERSASAATSAQETTSNIQAVAAATEEMSSTIDEINQQVVQASTVSRQAVDEVGETNRQMEILAEKANKISAVVDVISSIAEQTNLLALNATIESSRAGEVGKGFAVVASEVKALADQTARATEEIIQQINELQTASTQATTSIENVSQTIIRVDEISGAIAAAMEEQGAATQEIARSVSQAAQGSQRIDTDMASVTEAAGETGEATGEVKSAAEELARQAEYMKTEVNKFISEVRAS